MVAAVATVGSGALLYYLIHRGRSNLKPHNLAPQRTAQSLERDRQFVKEQMP